MNDSRKFSGLKLKAFTLLELLISILISAILMGLTLYTLNSFRKISNVYGLQQQTLFRVMTLHRLLVQDFSEAKKIKRTRNGVMIEKKSNTIEYTFRKEEYITRQQAKTLEEFEFEATLYQALYKKRPSFVYDDLIDELRFEIEIENEILPFHFIKMYASDVLMENEMKEK